MEQARVAPTYRRFMPPHFASGIPTRASGGSVMLTPTESLVRAQMPTCARDYVKTSTGRLGIIHSSLQAGSRRSRGNPPTGRLGIIDSSLQEWQP
ncbi:MAG: hypothetical protein AABN34_17040, partial [Acidobacteriota bacterium]